MIKQVVCSLLLLAVIVALTGCASGKVAGLSSPGLTKEEVNRRHYDTIQVGWWQLQDDIDSAFLFDRPSRRHRLSVR